MSEMDERTTVAYEAKSWVGTPWVHRSCVKGGGVDCAHLLIGVYKNAGIVTTPVAVPEYQPDFALHSSAEIFRRIVASYCQEIPLPPHTGDVVLFRYGQCASHAAIVIDWPIIVHAYIRTGKVVLDDAEKNADLRGKLDSAWSPWGAP